MDSSEKCGPASALQEAEKRLLCSRQSSSRHECSLAQEITWVQLLVIPQKNTKNPRRSRNEAVKPKLPGGLHHGNATIDRTDAQAQPRFPLPSPKIQQLPFRGSPLGAPTSRTHRCCPTTAMPPGSLCPKGVLSFQSSSTSHFSQT